MTRRERSWRTAVHDGERFLKPSIDADGEVTAVTVTEAGAVCTEEDAAAVWCPVEHHIVETAPGGHLTNGVVEGKLACSAPFGGHHPYLSAARIFGREGDPLTVG